MEIVKLMKLSKSLGINLDSAIKIDENQKYTVIIKIIILQILITNKNLIIL